MTEDASYATMIWRFVNKPRNTRPPAVLPSLKTSLHSSCKDYEAVITWFGHSSYLIYLGGIKILVDPVFSGHASPFSFTGKSFKGSDVYSTDDIPPIDVLILTHDHYDHMDYQTLLQLKPKVTRIITSLGVSAHLVYWGFPQHMVQELDWWQNTEINKDVLITATPARHFSGRFLSRNKSLWSSFVIRNGRYSIYAGSDSGYGEHFIEIGKRFGPFDIALLEAGQYNRDWPDIHMMPEETVQAAIDLKADVLMPVHWGKFALSFHAWDEPVKRIVDKANELNVKITTPLIGEPVILRNSYPISEWWLSLH